MDRYELWTRSRNDGKVLNSRLLNRNLLKQCRHGIVSAMDTPITDSSTRPSISILISNISCNTMVKTVFVNVAFATRVGVS